MNITLPTAPSGFVALIHGFLADAGQEADSQTPVGAVEITSGEFVVVLRPHPEDDALLLLEVEAVEASTLQEDSPVWMLLHRLNAETRFTTGWWIVVEDDSVLLTRVVSIAGTSPQALGSLIIEGLDRAQSLLSAMQSAADLDALEESPEESTPEMPAQFA